MKDNIIFDETFINNKYNKEHNINVFHDNIFNNL